MTQTPQLYPTSHSGGLSVHTGKGPCSDGRRQDSVRFLRSDARPCVRFLRMTTDVGQALPKTQGPSHITVSVTTEHIERAVPRDSGHCMIADAIKAAIPKAKSFASITASSQPHSVSRCAIPHRS